MRAHLRPFGVLGLLLDLPSVNCSDKQPGEHNVGKHVRTSFLPHLRVRTPRFVNSMSQRTVCWSALATLTPGVRGLCGNNPSHASLNTVRQARGMGSLVQVFQVLHQDLHIRLQVCGFEHGFQHLGGLCESQAGCEQVSTETAASERRAHLVYSQVY